MAEEVDRRPVTLAAPLHAPSASGPTAFYSHMQEELARILATCGGHAAAAITSSQAAFGDAAVPGHEVTPCTDAGDAIIIDSVRQLEVDIDRLWRLDTSILRTCDTADMLDAPPMLAPGPHVTGAGSAAVRLKQLRAAFVARSQQVNVAHNRYKCLCKHNDLYKTYVRVSSDSAGPPCGSPRSTVSPPPGGYFSHTSSASEIDTVTNGGLGGGLGGFSGLAGFSGSGALATSSAGSIAAFGPISQASSLGASVVAETVFHHPASHHPQQRQHQPPHKPASPPPHAVPESCFSSAQLMDVDVVPPCGSAGSASASPPGTPTAARGVSRRSTADAEVLASSRESSPSSRGRGGLLGLGAFFGRARQPQSPPEAPLVIQQVPPTIQEEDCVVPEVRQACSKPLVIGRRGALELSHESLANMFARRGFAITGDEAGPSQRRSREAKRSGESLRSKSEPAMMTRDSRRRRNFFLEVADNDPPVSEAADTFTNPDLESRVQIFASEPQLYRDDEEGSCDYTSRRTSRV